jgi:hypothetical protein
VSFQDAATYPIWGKHADRVRWSVNGRTVVMPPPKRDDWDALWGLLLWAVVAADSCLLIRFLWMVFLT